MLVSAFRIFPAFYVYLAFIGVLWSMGSDTADFWLLYSCLHVYMELLSLYGRLDPRARVVALHRGTVLLVLAIVTVVGRKSARASYRTLYYSSIPIHSSCYI